MGTSFGYGWYNGDVPQSLDSWSSCNVRGNMGVGRIAGDYGIVVEAVSEDGM